MFVTTCILLCVCLLIGTCDSVRCPTCVEFSARLKKSLSQEERDNLMRAQTEHIGMVRDYRLTQSRYASLSEDPSSSLVKIDIDFCDQAKFKCPRNVDSSKATESLWRPQLHLGGGVGVGCALVAKIPGFSIHFLSTKISPTAKKHLRPWKHI